MNYLIRKLKQDESKVLDTFLYEAIFIPEGVSAPSKDIVNQPDLQVYVKDFGKNKGDLCLVAQVSDKIVGAVWVRIMNDYGHIDNETPSFAISLLLFIFTCFSYRKRQATLQSSYQRTSTMLISQ